MSREVRKGYVLLLLLLGIGIVVILYTVDMKRLFGWGEPPSPEDCPWLEEHRIAEPGQEIVLPQPPKPSLEQFTGISAPVVREAISTKPVSLTISPDGMIIGAWNAEYEQDKMVYTYQAGFMGNIDVEKTFTDEHGNEDPSLLFFIGKGKFMKQIYNVRTTRGGVRAGQSYIIGWLHPDGKSHGKIVLSYSPQEYETWTWEQ